MFMRMGMDLSGISSLFAGARIAGAVEDVARIFISMAGFLKATIP
jgi:hypothetical protein